MRSPLLILGAVLVVVAGCGAAGPPQGAAAGPRTVTPATSSPAPAASAPAPASTAAPVVPTVLGSPVGLPTYATVSAPTDSVVWMLVGGVELFVSPDRGATWRQRPMPAAATGTGAISFLDDRQGWLLSNPTGRCDLRQQAIWHTADGGASWEQVPASGLAAGRCGSALTFSDATHALLPATAVGAAPVVYRSADGGRSWTASGPLPNPPGTSWQSGALSPGPPRSFGAARLLQAGSAVFVSPDGGATWSYRASSPDGLTALGLVSASRWIELAGAGQAKETVDTGATWHPYVSDYTQAAGVAPQIVFGGGLVGYATVRGGLSRTEDGGAHWTSLTTPGTR